VSFHLKTDLNGPVQYGLIAEEVATIYPELVIRDATGNVQGVRYEELAPMLLNEVQKQAAEIRALKQQQEQFAKQADAIAAQAVRIASFEQKLAGIQASLAR
jgi:hypothetical protein